MVYSCFLKISASADCVNIIVGAVVVVDDAVLTVWLPAASRYLRRKVRSL